MNMYPTDKNVCGGARGIVITVVGNGRGNSSSNPWLFELYVALIPLEKVWIQLFSFHL